MTSPKTASNSLNAKQALRKEIKTRLQALNLPVLSLAAEAHLIASPLFQQATSILSYAALPDELDLTPLLSSWPTKHWYFPRVLETTIAFYPVQALTELTAGEQWGIREPCTEAIPWQAQTASAHTLILVPGRAFSTSGQRLGRGKGFYDRFLSPFTKLHSDGQLCAIGVAPAVCIQETIPCDPWDQPVDYLLSEERLQSVALR